MSGNQFDYHCPECGSDEKLWITATLEIEGELLPDGVDAAVGDFEFSDNDKAHCNNCGWTGKVDDLLEGAGPAGQRREDWLDWADQQYEERRLSG
jgi:hypothetical protein